MRERQPTVLVHLASGIGNIVLATPLLVALNQMGFTSDLLLHSDYPQTADLLRDWSAVRAIYSAGARVNVDHDFIVPAIPPVYWRRFAQRGFSLPQFAEAIRAALAANPHDGFLSSLAMLQKHLAVAEAGSSSFSSSSSPCGRSIAV